MSIKYGLARVQFITCYSEIIDLLDKGYTVKNIYDDFIKSKKVTMSYRAFSRYVNLRIKNSVDETKTANKTDKKEAPVKQQEKKQEQNLPALKKENKPKKVFSPPEKQEDFGSGLHRDADEVC